MIFREFVSKDILSIDVNTSPMFIEFLAYNGLKHVSILNYISAKKSLFKWLEISSTVIDNMETGEIDAQGGVSLHYQSS